MVKYTGSGLLETSLLMDDGNNNHNSKHSNRDLAVTVHNTVVIAV